MVAIQCAKPSTGAGVLFGGRGRGRGRGRGARLRVEPLNTCAMQIWILELVRRCWLAGWLMPMRN